MDPDDLAALISDEGRALLAELAALPAAALEDPLPVLSRARAAGHPPALAAAALTQARLRVRARAKLGADADLMLLTRQGHEQATRRPVAEHRAARLAASGATLVADLCCGLGADTVAMARAGLRVLAVEQDAVTARLARANVDALGLGHLVDVRTADARDAVRDGLLRDVDAAFVDPGRRGERGRVFDPAAYSPPFSFVAELATAVPATVAKVAPGIPHDLPAEGVETEWVSDHGGVKEAALWHGPLAASGVRRRATLLPSGATLSDGDPETRQVRAPGRWLHEPDGALVRAGLVGQVAATVEGGLLDARIAYVTTDADVGSPFTHRFEVVESLPFGLKPLRAALRRLGYGDVVVKKRGSAVVPEQLRRQLALHGDGPTATVVLTRVAERPWAFVTTATPT